jgi:hypothetical protein
MLKIADTIHEFARGSTFEAIMSLAETVPDNYFSNYSTLSQIRRAGQLTNDGLIGVLDFTWLGPRQFSLITNQTDDWPLGLAEFDVLFTAPDGRRIRTKTITLRIKAGISQ